MRDKEVKARIQSAMDHSLAGLDCDAALAQRVLTRAQTEKGEQKVMKKISGSLIFAIVLVLLLAATAFALSNWDQLKTYFETVRTMDNEGELARWLDEDKLKLLSAMANAGLVDENDARLLTARDESLTLSERGAAADQIIAERYGENYFDSYTVEQLELPVETRTQETQAEYSQWSENYWNTWNAQEQQPLTESRTYRATMDNLTEIGDFPRELLRDVTVSAVWSEEDQLYLVTASIDKETYLAAKTEADQTSLFDIDGPGYADGDSLCFQFWLNKYGAFTGINDPNSPKNRAEITLAQAQVIAEKALLVRLNVGQDTLDGMTLDANFAENGEYILAEGRFNAVCSFIWRVNGEARYMVDIDAKTGRVVKAFDWLESNTMKEKGNAWIAELQALLKAAGVSDTLYNAQGTYFWFWTHEERAAWSAVARPIVQQYIAEHAEFAQYLEDLLANRYAQHDWHNLIAFTQYVYGVPDDAAITQEKAFEIARAAALSRGANQRYIDENKSHAFYYDTTNPDRPVWKVLVSVLFGDGDAEHPSDPTAPWGYFAVIDAHTGELLQMTDRTVNTDIREIV